MGHLLPFQTKSPTRIFAVGWVFLAYRASRAMLFQWGCAKRKSPMKPPSAGPVSVWRTLYTEYCLDLIESMSILDGEYWRTTASFAFNIVDQHTMLSLYYAHTISQCFVCFCYIILPIVCKISNMHQINDVKNQRSSDRQSGTAFINIDQL